MLIMETLRDGLNRAASMHGAVSGHVSVGLSNEYVDGFAVDLIRGIQRTYPLIQMELRFFPPNGLLRAIDNHSIDIIFSSDTPRGEQLKFKLLRQYRNCVLLPDDHPLAGRSELSFDEIKNEGIIIIDNMISGDEYDTVIETARSEGCSPHVIGAARSVPELLTQVACGRGIAVLSDKYAGLAGKKLVFVPLRLQSYSRLHLIWRDCSNPCIEAITAFASAVGQL